jgi:hypothetical protein
MQHLDLGLGPDDAGADDDGAVLLGQPFGKAASDN